MKRVLSTRRRSEEGKMPQTTEWTFSTLVTTAGWYSSKDFCSKEGIRWTCLLPCCNSLNSDHVMIFIWEVTVVLLIHNGMQSVTCGKLHNWMVTWSEGCKHVSRIRPPAHTAEEFDLLCFLWVIKWEGRVRQKYMARGWWLQSHDKQRNGMRSTNDFPSNLT